MINRFKVRCDNKRCHHARADHRKIQNKPGLGVCWVDRCGCDRFILPELPTVPAQTEAGKKLARV